MELELLAYSTRTLKSNKDFLTKTAFQKHPNTTRQKLEKNLIDEVVKYGIKEKTKVYKVMDKTGTLDKIIGMVALSASKIEVDKNAVIPCAELDLLYINNLYRKTKYEAIENRTLGEELLLTIISLVAELSKSIGIKYLILIPLGQVEELKNFYKQFGFETMPTQKDWMYLKISDLK